MIFARELKVEFFQKLLIGHYRILLDGIVANDLDVQLRGHNNQVHIYYGESRVLNIQNMPSLGICRAEMDAAYIDGIVLPDKQREGRYIVTPDFVKEYLRNLDAICKNADENPMRKGRKEGRGAFALSG